MKNQFEPLIKKKWAITYIDDTIMQPQNKGEMFSIIHEYHNLLRKAGPKAVPEKTFFFLKKWKFWDTTFYLKEYSQLQNRLRTWRLLNHLSPNETSWKCWDVLDFTAASSKISMWTANHSTISLEFLSALFYWTENHERIFQIRKDIINEDTIFTIPSTEYLFHIHVDSSNEGTGCILIQQFPGGKRIIFFNSRIFDKAEQKTSTLHRELCGIVSALQTFEHYIIGSLFPIYLYCDHKPILYLWGRKGPLSHRFFRYQVVITKFQNLKILWTPGSDLALPDTLSRNLTIDEYQHHQFQHKKLPRASSVLTNMDNR